MNLGKRRITNDELCACFEAIGFSGVAAFLASGNVVLQAEEVDAAVVAERIETGLREALNYEVPAYVRRAGEVLRIAGAEPFSASEIARSNGKLQVAMLAQVPSKQAQEAVLALATEEDRLALDGQELYWLPSGGILDSELNLKGIEKTVGPWTMRTRRTLERMAKKFFDEG